MVQYSDKSKLIWVLIGCIILFALIPSVYDPTVVHEGFDFGMIFDAIGKLFELFSMVGQIFEAFLNVMANFPLFLKFFVDAVFRFLPELFLWLGEFLICTIKKIILLPKCALWYALDVVGEIIYLIFRFMFFVLDMIFQRDITQYMDYFLGTMEEVDQLIYDLANFHIFHYPKSVVDKCYTCTISAFPRTPVWPF